MSSSDLPKICVREDQVISSALNQKYQNDCVTIVAPKWMSEALETLSQFIPNGTKFEINDSKSERTIFTVTDGLNLKTLTMVARNERRNTSGRINFANYSPLNLSESVIYSLKDLVRQCVIVGKDMTTHYGGYPRRCPAIEQSCDVYVADLIGLSFQNKYNSGRLVLISKRSPKGLLDEFIFEKVVGEKKSSYERVVNDTTGRYVKHNSDVYFDTFAYEKFVSNDVLITGLALNLIADQYLNFKFLKYGCGFFAGGFGYILEKHIAKGVAAGLEKLFEKNQGWIKSIELPYYDYNQEVVNVCKLNNIECKFSSDDALKRTHATYVTATTNCADSHAITGNTMGYKSVDAAIAQNLKSKANIFSPIINRVIREKFIDA